MLLATREKWRNEGKRVVFTNGCFDLLHIGHIRLLREARNLGDLLIVGINSDLSVKKLKGFNRPVQGELDRLEILSSIRDVDGVVIFEETTPVSLLEKLKPDIHVKGGDYRAEDLPEYAVVTGYGGVVHIVNFVADRSTSHIFAEITNMRG
jgi:glycerol-3-phosphate cytidylyltransferase